MERIDAPIEKGAIVSLQPPYGCCNSTQCFEEWEVRSRMEINGEIALYLVVPVHGDEANWRAVRLREIHSVLKVH